METNDHKGESGSKSLEGAKGGEDENVRMKREFPEGETEGFKRVKLGEIARDDNLQAIGYNGGEIKSGDGDSKGIGSTDVNNNVNYNKNSSSSSSNISTKLNDNTSANAHQMQIRPNSSSTEAAGIVLPNVPQSVGNGKPKKASKDALKSKDGAPLSPTDPDKMADALYGTGVDLKEEETLLHRESEKHKNKINNTATSNVGISSDPKRTETVLAPLIVRSQVFEYAKQQILEHGLRVPPGQDKQMADFLAVACEEMLSPVLRDMVMYSRHRRRTIKSSNGIRSDVSKALRDYAAKQKELEEKRLSKKIQLGIHVDDEKNKPKAEELLHRAANATAALMTSGRTKTYSWMTGAGGSSSGMSSSAGARSADNPEGKGVRYREARQEEVFSVRDLVRALENRKRGVDRTLAKSYSKLKDMYR